MSRPPSDDLPDIGAVLAPLLARVPVERQPLLIALAERLAARRYRAWAREPTLAAHADRLRACAEREEDIACRVEALAPDAAAFQDGLRTEHPELETIDRTLFADRPLREQLTIQARGERLGAATWRAFARRATDARQRDTFTTCAELEEASAVVLEELVGAGT